MLKQTTFTDNGTFGPFTHEGGPLIVSGVGTYGGGTLAVRVDHGAGFTVEESFTTNRSTAITAVGGSRIELVLSGATSPNLPVCIRS